MVNVVENFFGIIRTVFLCLPDSIQYMLIFAFVLVAILAVIKLLLR